MRTSAPLRALPALALAIVFLAGSAGAQSTPTSNRGWQPPEHVHDDGFSPVVTQALIPDGSFEQGPPPGSNWTVFTSNPACARIGNFSGIHGVAAFHGSNVYWAGGYCAFIGVTSNVTQVLNVPSDVIQLSFWTMSNRGDPDDEGLDKAYVAVDGDTIWTLPMIQANNSSPNWINRMVDFTPYAGQTVTLELGGISVGLTGNVLFDFLEYVQQPVSTEAVTWGRIKALHR